jgi:hypothetical protein
MNSPSGPSLRLELQLVSHDDVAGVEPLHIPIEWMRFCYSCNREAIFVANHECVFGLIGRCTHCGDERVSPFTRTISESAWEALS